MFYKLLHSLLVPAFVTTIFFWKSLLFHMIKRNKSILQFTTTIFVNVHIRQQTQLAFKLINLQYIKDSLTNSSIQCYSRFYQKTSILADLPLMAWETKNISWSKQQNSNYFDHDMHLMQMSGNRWFCDLADRYTS